MHFKENRKEFCRFERAKNVYDKNMKNDTPQNIQVNNKLFEAYIILKVEYASFDIRDILNTCSTYDCIISCSNLINGGDYALEIQAKAEKDIYALVNDLSFNYPGIDDVDLYLSGSKLYPFNGIN